MPEVILVSFVVIAYNEAVHIERTLASIDQLEGLSEHEIIVVDDGSRDGTAQIVANIARHNPYLKLIELKENRGRGYARGRGVTEARGQLIAMVDADIVLPVDWLERTQAALTDYDAVGGIAVPDGDVAYVHKRFGLVPRIVHGTTTVAGSNGLYRREVFDVVAFDPALREGEDSALNHGMNRLGLSYATVPGMLVQHQESKTFTASLRWLFDTGRGATRQLLTYHEVRQPDLAAGAFTGAAALGTYLALRGRRLIGPALPVGFVLAASLQHIRSRFETSRSPRSKVAPAVAADSAMLAAYFVGRIAGVTAVWRHPDLAWPRNRGRHAQSRRRQPRWKVAEWS